MPRNRKGTQPVRAPSGGPQGQRKQLETAQKAIPLPEGSGPPGGAAPPNGVAPVQRPDVFGATTRPGEPLTAGAPAGPGSNGIGMLPDDPVEFLRAVYLQFPSPGLRRLIETSGGQSQNASPVS